jgi:ribosome-associated protein
LKSKKLAELVVAALEDMKGQSIRCINVEKLTTITDYMVIATGTSSTHIKALSDNVVVKVKAAKQSIVGVEGKMQSEWVLVDAGGVVVHIMMAPVRALYNLEELWDFKAQGGDRDDETDMAAVTLSESVKPKARTTARRTEATRARARKPAQSQTGSGAKPKTPASKRAPAKRRSTRKTTE